MISTEASRSGHPILRFEGRLLASSIDPIREANTWAKRAFEEARGAESVLVIGLGCGYHVEELRALAPAMQIFVAEPSMEVVDWNLANHPNLSREKILVGSDFSQLLVEWTDALSMTTAYLVHGASAQIHPEWTDSVLKFVLARDKTAFLTRIRALPNLLAILDPDRIAAMNEEPVSINTLRGLFRADPVDSQERRLWRVLEELVT